MQHAPSVTSLVVAGEEVAGGSTVEVTSPWDGRTVGAVPWLGADAARAAVDGAWDAMQAGLHRRGARRDPGSRRRRGERAPRGVRAR